MRAAHPGLRQVWVHGDHLLTAPHFVRRAFPEANVGFFFHTPFPSSGIFRMFQFRFEILNSLLQCDLVGFHLFEYARNFLMTCHRILGLNYEFMRGGYLGVNNHGKSVMIRVSHVGVDEDFFEGLLRSSAFKKHVRAYQRQIKDMSPLFKGRPIILASANVAHPIAGIQNKLAAYLEFLRKYPNYRSRVCMIQYAAPVLSVLDCDKALLEAEFTDKIDLLRRFKAEVQELVEKIHREFGGQSLIVIEDAMTLEKRLALWSVTDVFLISNLKDGLCMVSSL